MKRITLIIDDQTDAELRALARRRRPVAVEVRKALARHVAKARAVANGPLSFIAIGASGYRDTADCYETLLRSEWGSLPIRSPCSHRL